MEALESSSKDPLNSILEVQFTFPNPKLFEDKPSDSDNCQTDDKVETDDNQTPLPPLPLSHVPKGLFPYYGCALCNISYLELKELDQHVVVTHKNRMTSWDFQVQKKRKRKKELKSKKKKKKGKDTETMKAENADVKPENADVKPENADVKPEAADVKPEAVDMKPEAESVKTVEKIYKCASCFKLFALSYYLKLHVRSHTGEKPYQCSECGLAFITASKLGRHRKMHTECKFECRICHKMFSRFDTLAKHFDKKHLEQKLEGEPYDYNAILPYLKELENEVSARAPKSDINIEDKETIDKIEIKIELGRPMPEIKMEDLDLKLEDTFESELSDDCDVFTETLDNDIKSEDGGEVKPEVKHEDLTDNEDYFPIDAWTTPHCDVGDEGEDSAGLKKINVKLKKKKKVDNIVSDHAEAQDNPLQCKICGKHIKTPTYYRIHMRTHTGEKPFKCYICCKGFITSSKMNRHVLTHLNHETKSENNETDLMGEKDGSVISKKPSKKLRKARKNKIYTDSIIQGGSKTIRKRKHMCEFCNKKFLHIETLNVHRQTHSNDSKTFNCQYCLSQFDSNDALVQHEVSHNGLYICTICEKTFKKKETMIYHRRTHQMEKKYQCDICSKSFIVPCKLQRHLLTHRPDKFVVRYECPVCAHIFNTKYHVEMHLTTHEKDGLIQPENRGEVLAMVQQNARKIPLRTDSPTMPIKELVPMDERSRICNICGEYFNHFYYLEEHLKTHGTRISSDSEVRKSKLEAAERRYICQICNKGFKLHYYLKLHHFTHTKEKPFICQQCGKGFITKGKLKRHLESHTGLKKFQCHICYKYFTRPSYLRIHVKTIHGVAKEVFLDNNFYRGC